MDNTKNGNKRNNKINNLIKEFEISKQSNNYLATLRIALNISRMLINDSLYSEAFKYLDEIKACDIPNSLKLDTEYIDLFSQSLILRIKIFAEPK